MTFPLRCVEERTWRVERIHMREPHVVASACITAAYDSCEGVATRRHRNAAHEYAARTNANWCIGSVNPSNERQAGVLSISADACNASASA